MSGISISSINATMDVGIGDGPDVHAFGGNEGRDIFIMHSQMEDGLGGTSVIITSGSTVTRAAEVITNTVMAQSIDNLQGTIFSRFSTQFALQSVDLGERFGWSIQHGDTDYVRAYVDTASNSWKYRVTSGSDNQALQEALVGSYNFNDQHQSGVGYLVNSFAGVVSDEAIVTDNAGVTPSSIDEIEFGKGGTFELNGWLREWSYFDFRISNTQISEKVS